MEGTEEVRLDSGATLSVTLAPWKDAKSLHDAVLKALRGKGLGELDVAKLQTSMLNSPETFNLVADRVLELASSKEIEEAIFCCAKRAAYEAGGDTEKIVPALFDGVHGEQARGDYYSICYHVMRANLAPFYQALLSALKGFRSIPTGIQASK